jgi:hypothetical protein
MANTTNLGGVFTTDLDGNITSTSYVSTENVCGLIFDTKIAGGLSAALGSGTAATSFANGNVVELNVLKDCDEVGLDSSVMGGLPYYHVQQFFKLTGSNARLFVSFMDSSTDTNFEAVEQMQLASGGIIYQIGVWTGEAIATTGTDDYVIPENGIISKLQAVAETLGGKIGTTNYEGNSPVNIILNAPILAAATCDYKKLPDLLNCAAPKVSVILGQSTSDSCHEVQLAVNNLTSTSAYAVVGNVGAALACLSVAPANESIAHVASFNLSAVMTDAELGFGNLTQTDKQWGANVSFTGIKTIGYVKRNKYLHQKGYIFLTNYDGLENSVFFSSDQTLTTGDYRTIARCRVMHKSRRVVRRALLPYVNSSVEVDTSTGQISSSDITSFQNVVLNALDANLVEPGTSVPQISGRSCTIDEEQDILTNDQLLISYTLIPLGTTAVISVTEGFSATEASE